MALNNEELRLAQSNKAATIAKIGRDLRLTRGVAGAQLVRTSEDCGGLSELARDTGQMTYLAMGDDNPPGRPTTECRWVAVVLTLDSAVDRTVALDGLAALRRGKIERLTREAQEQGALLTQDDLARLLCTSRSTVKRDIAHLRAVGIAVPTRGQSRGTGRRRSG